MRLLETAVIGFTSAISVIAGEGAITGSVVDGAPQFEILIPGDFTPAGIHASTNENFSWADGVTVDIDGTEIGSDYYTTAFGLWYYKFIRFTASLKQEQTATMTFNAIITSGVTEYAPMILAVLTIDATNSVKTTLTYTTTLTIAEEVFSSADPMPTPDSSGYIVDGTPYFEITIPDWFTPVGIHASTNEIFSWADGLTADVHGKDIDSDYYTSSVSLWYYKFIRFTGSLEAGESATITFSAIPTDTVTEYAPTILAVLTIDATNSIKTTVTYLPVIFLTEDAKSSDVVSLTSSSAITSEAVSSTEAISKTEAVSSTENTRSTKITSDASTSTNSALSVPTVFGGKFSDAPEFTIKVPAEFSPFDVHASTSETFTWSDVLDASVDGKPTSTTTIVSLWYYKYFKFTTAYSDNLVGSVVLSGVSNGAGEYTATFFIVANATQAPGFVKRDNETYTVTATATVVEESEFSDVSLTTINTESSEIRFLPTPNATSKTTYATTSKATSATTAGETGKSKPDLFSSARFANSTNPESASISTKFSGNSASSEVTLTTTDASIVVYTTTKCQGKCSTGVTSGVVNKITTKDEAGKTVTIETTMPCETTSTSEPVVSTTLEGRKHTSDKTEGAITNIISKVLSTGISTVVSTSESAPTTDASISTFEGSGTKGAISIVSALVVFVAILM